MSEIGHVRSNSDGDCYTYLKSVQSKSVKYLGRRSALNAHRQQFANECQNHLQSFNHRLAGRGKTGYGTIKVNVSPTMPKLRQSTNWIRKLP